MSYYRGVDSHLPRDVIRTQAMSDRKSLGYVTSPERDRKPHVTSLLVGAADPATATPQMMMDLRLNHQRHEQDGGRSLEEKSTSTKLLERRLGKMKHEQQLRLIVDRLNANQHELLAAEGSSSDYTVSRQVALVATSGELANAQTPSRPGRQSAETPTKMSPLPGEFIDWKVRHRQRSVESDGSSPPVYHPPSPFTPDYITGYPGPNAYYQDHMRNQHVSSAWTPVRHQNVSRSNPSMQRPSGPPLTPDRTPAETTATRRQMAYEAGLRRFGVNHRPQHSWSSNDDYERHPANRQALSNGTIPCLIDIP